jgi:hypothetical protein
VQVFLSPGVAIGGIQWEVQILSAGIRTQALRFLFQCCVQVFLSPSVAIGGIQWEV